MLGLGLGYLHPNIESVPSCLSHLAQTCGVRLTMGQIEVGSCLLSKRFQCGCFGLHLYDCLVQIGEINQSPIQPDLNNICLKTPVVLLPLAWIQYVYVYVHVHFCPLYTLLFSHTAELSYVLRANTWILYAALCFDTVYSGTTNTVFLVWHRFTQHGSEKLTAGGV